MDIPYTRTVNIPPLLDMMFTSYVVFSSRWLFLLFRIFLTAACLFLRPTACLLFVVIVRVGVQSCRFLYCFCSSLRLAFPLERHGVLVGNMAFRMFIAALKFFMRFASGDDNVVAVRSILYLELIAFCLGECGGVVRVAFT